MSDTVTNELLLEHLKKIQAELSHARERDSAMTHRLSHIETSLGRIVRDEASNYAELIQDRHVVDKLATRIDRIERRLEISDN